MTLLTPILRTPIKPFNANMAHVFDFYYSGSNQAVKNNLIIQRNTDNVEIYNQTLDTLQLKHTIPSNTLQNGNEYKVSVRIADINGNWSNFSDWIVFWVLDDANLNCTTINDGKVYNQTVMFETTYTHPDSELLESYRYLLYDSNKNLLNTFTEKFSDGLSSLTQEIAGLQNDVLYYIEIKTISIHGQESTSGFLNFKPKYIAPKLTATLTTENISEQGSIKISANILQLIGKVGSGEIDYIDNDWVSLRNGSVVFEEGFNIYNSDFMLKIWLKDIPNDVVFLTLTSNSGKIQLIKNNNVVHAYKYLNGVSRPSHFISNELHILPNQECMIYLKSIFDGIDIIQKVV